MTVRDNRPSDEKHETCENRAARRLRPLATWWIARPFAAALAALLLALSLLLSAGCSNGTGGFTDAASSAPAAETLADVPAYDGSPYVEIAGDEPSFSDEELARAEEAARADDGFEDYGQLDRLGRCKTVVVCVGPETMPEGERGSIGMVKPSGWHTSKYDFVDGKYLYNRCHLVGWQLSGENANEENLITGTRYMNTEGMLPFEDEVADYVHETGNHVLYRVTPIFEGDELVARGVQIEAESVEDGGAGVSFNVYCYNVQPGVEIDYTTGENREADDAAGEIAAAEEEASGAATSAGAGATDDGQPHDYVLNTRSRKFHLPDCDGAADMSGRNRDDVSCTRDELIGQGYEPCGRCNP